MAKFPPDRFDGVSESLSRVGAHRAGKRRLGWLVVLGWSALACGVLVLAGYAVLVATDASFNFKDTSTAAPVTSAPATGTGTATPKATPTSTPTPTATPAAPDATSTIAVYNGTTTTGLAARAATTLTSAGWSIPTQGNAAAQTSTSVVYYSSSSPANESVALGVAKSLGIATVEASTAYPNSTVAVVLGSDFTG